MVKKLTCQEPGKEATGFEEERAAYGQVRHDGGDTDKRFQLVCESKPLGYLSLNEKGRLIEINQAALDVLGYTRGEVIGRYFEDLLHPEGQAHIKENLPRFLAAGEILGAEFEMLRKDGSVIAVLFNGRINRDEKGNFQQTHCILQDITEHKFAEEKLLETEKKYGQLIENSLTGIYIDQDERIVFANKRFADIYRYPRDEILGIASWKLVHPEDRGLTNRLRAERLKGYDVPLEYEARGLTKDGKTIWILRRNTRIEHRGRPAILGNIADITQQKWVEEELRLANEELKDFVQVVTHDLKNPLIAIQGFSARLMKSYRDKLGRKGMVYLDYIKSSVRQIEVLVTDLVALSKVGRVDFFFKEASAREIVNKVIQIIQPRLKEKRIKIDVAKNLPVIYCDEDKIYQVFENLLTNATKFIENSKSARIEIGHEDKGNFHQFFVRDNGIGIDKKNHCVIFEKFHRLREIEDKEGTGLGLAIVERIITNHGGSIWVESEKGKGATFFFTLPKSS